MSRIQRRRTQMRAGTSKSPRRERKRLSYVEPFSMATRESIASVATRFEDGEQVPAINVKPPLLYHRMPAELQSVSADIRNEAFEEVKDEWWDLVAPDLAQHYLFPAFDEQLGVRKAGRNAGWLIVVGIGSPEGWSAKQLKAWHRFEKAVKQSMLDAEKEWHRQIRERL